MSYVRPARDSLLELQRLEAVGRGPRAEVWFPLLVNGVICIGSSPTVLLIGREHLGAYFLPLSLAGGALCALQYRRSGRVTGLQAPLFAWLAVIASVSVAAAMASYEGRERGWDALNLAGPGLALALGYGVLAAWTRSNMLVVAVAGIVASVAFAVSVAEGDPVIAIYTGLIGVLFFGLARQNHAWSRRCA